MPASIPKFQANYTVSLVPVSRDAPLNEPWDSWQPASTLALSVPRVLVNFYDQRISAQLTGELFNAEAAIVMLNESEAPIDEDSRFSQISWAEGWIGRATGELADISPYFATGQAQVLGVQMRQLIVAPYAFICRNLTVVLYFGSITIGRQTTNSRIYQAG